MKRSELVQLVVDRAGISEPQAEKAVNVVLQQLKSRLPAPLAAQMDAFLGDGESQTGGSGLGDMAKRAGGLLGQ